jgi:peroxiredoxin
MNRPTPLADPTTPIALGATAPNFTLKDQSKQDWTLSEAVKKGDVVLCFYPMDFSPVCSTEMKCVTEDLTKWAGGRNGKTVQVVGVSCDSFYTHEAWAHALGLRQTLLADMHREVCKAYGFYWPDLNISGRGTVVIGQSDSGVGRVRWVQQRAIPQAMSFDEVLASLA